MQEGENYPARVSSGLRMIKFGKLSIEQLTRIARNAIRHRKGTTGYRMGAGQMSNDALNYRPDHARIMAAPGRRPCGSLRCDFTFSISSAEKYDRNENRTGPVRYIKSTAVHRVQKSQGPGGFVEFPFNKVSYCLGRCPCLPEFDCIQIPQAEVAG